MRCFENPLAMQHRELWTRVEAQELTSDDAMAEQQRLLAGYRRIWSQALPMHIVRDFGPVFARFGEKGFKEVWRDDWLWGPRFRTPD